MNEREQSRFATRSFLRHAAWLAAGYVIGYLNNAALLGVFIAAATALGWHLFNQARLYGWMNTNDSDAVPYDGGGTWPPIYARIQHFRERSYAHKQRSVELAEAQESFVRSLPNVAFILNETFEVTGCNDNAAALLDLDVDAITGPITNHLRQPMFVNYLKSDKYSEGVLIDAPRNPEQTFQCVISPHSDDRWLLQLSDISAQVKAMQIREDFIANASHELRTPVTVVAGYLESIKDDPSIDADLKEPLNAMGEQVSRMSAIIKDLLELNALESAGPAPVDEIVDVAAIIRSLYAEAHQSGKNKAKLELDLDEHLGVRGHEQELRSVVSNLMSNALRFTPETGNVKILWARKDHGAQLCVEDNGIGISEDDLNRVTERFYRTDAGRNQHQHGTGLGLAIVKHALARHQSDLEISSEYNVGSQFCAAFPSERLVTLDD